MDRFRRNHPRATVFGAFGVFAGLALMLMGVPLASLLVLGLLLMCPLMMVGMHMGSPRGGKDREGHGHDSPDHGGSLHVTEPRPDRYEPPRVVPTDRDPR